MKVPVVIDTNILISGYLWKGTPRKVIRFARSENYELLYCTESMTELVRILFILKHYKRGIALMLTVSAGLLVIIVKAVQQAVTILEKIGSEGGAIDMNTISKAATRASIASYSISSCY